MSETFSLIFLVYRCVILNILAVLVKPVNKPILLSDFWSNLCGPPVRINAICKHLTVYNIRYLVLKGLSIEIIEVKDSSRTFLWYPYFFTPKMIINLV